MVEIKPNNIIFHFELVRSKSYTTFPAQDCFYMESKFYRIFLLPNLALVLILAFQLTTTTSYAERIYSVVFHKLPQDYQLYPRDANNEANVPVSGFIELPGYNYMSVQVFRNEVPIKYLKAEIKYDGKGIGSFSTSATIKAE